MTFDPHAVGSDPFAWDLEPYTRGLDPYAASLAAYAEGWNPDLDRLDPYAGALVTQADIEEIEGILAATGQGGAERRRLISAYEERNEERLRKEVITWTTNWTPPRWRNG